MVMLERAEEFHELLVEFAREVGALPGASPFAASTDDGDAEAASA
jgi:hypothetical protein